LIGRGTSCRSIRWTRTGAAQERVLVHALARRVAAAAAGRCWSGSAAAPRCTLLQRFRAVARDHGIERDPDDPARRLRLVRAAPPRRLEFLAAMRADRAVAHAGLAAASTSVWRTRRTRRHRGRPAAGGGAGAAGGAGCRLVINRHLRGDGASGRRRAAAVLPRDPRAPRAADGENVLICCLDPLGK